MSRIEAASTGLGQLESRGKIKSSGCLVDAVVVCDN